MSVKRFCYLSNDANFSKNDKIWFPKWLRRYASSVDVTAADLPVTEQSVIKFLRSLLQSGTPAWQRLQAVRAVDAYRNLVLRTDEPTLQGHPTKVRTASRRRSLETRMASSSQCDLLFRAIGGAGGVFGAGFETDGLAESEGADGL